jgi:sugar lactone lactonase YvrE
MNSQYVKFNGNFYTVTINGVSGYSGLFQNGSSSSNGYANTWITQLGVLSNGSILSTNAGWIGQRYFGKGTTNVLLDKCWSNGATVANSGGLIGSNSELYTIQNCYNCFEGVVGSGSGGISGNGSTNVAFINCYSWCTIFSLTSGGALAGDITTNCTFTNCYGLQKNMFGGQDDPNILINCYGSAVWDNIVAADTLGPIVNAVNIVPVTPIIAPISVAFDPTGANLYVADTSNNSISSVVVETTIASTLISSGLNNPSSVALDSSGNIYISDTGNGAVKKAIMNKGSITSVSTILSGLNTAAGITLDSADNVYVCDSGTNCIHKVTTSGTASIIVSTGLNQPADLTVDTSGNLYIADKGSSSIKKVPVGSSTPSTLLEGCNSPNGIIIDSTGILYVADTGNHVIKKVTTSGTVTSVAGTTGSSGLVNGPGIIAQFNSPSSVTVDAFGNVLVADRGNGLIRPVYGSKTNYYCPRYVGDPVLTTPAVSSIWTDIYGLINITGTADVIRPDLWRLSAFCRNSYTGSINTPVYTNLYTNPYTNSYNNYYSSTYNTTNVDNTQVIPRLQSGNYYVIGVNDQYYKDSIYSPPEISTFSASNPQILVGTGNSTDFNDLNPGNYSTYVLYNDPVTSNYNIMYLNMTTDPPCYHEKTQILCDIGYVPISNLKIGDLVKISTGKYKRVKIIGSTPLVNTTLYRLPKESNLDLIDDLIITGNHCILVNKLTERQIEQSRKYWKTFHTIDGKQLLLACVGEDFVEYKEEQSIVYQIVLEDAKPNKRHGIYANGILSETMSYNTFINKNKNRFRSIESKDVL